MKDKKKRLCYAMLRFVMLSYANGKRKIKEKKTTRAKKKRGGATDFSVWTQQ